MPNLTNDPWSEAFSSLADPATHLDLLFDESREFPLLEDPERFLSARVWQCRYRTLEPLSALRNLRALEVMVYPDATLAPLRLLGRLEELRILHMPNVSDLSPLGGLKALRRLSLETLPSWDASSKATTVSSLLPLAELPLLEDLALLGVRTPDRSVDALLQLPALRKVALLKYPRTEVARIHASIADRYGVTFSNAD